MIANRQKDEVMDELLKGSIRNKAVMVLCPKRPKMYVNEFEWFTSTRRKMKI